MGIIILYPAFLCTAPCKGNKLLYSTRGAQRVGEDESSLLDCQYKDSLQKAAPVV